jgi:glutamyl-tRNA reductase
MHDPKKMELYFDSNYKDHKSFLVPDGFEPSIYAEKLVSKDRKVHEGDAGKKVVVDLSVPHNVAAQVVENFNVEYVEIEGLRSVAEEHRSFREQECAKAAVLIQERIYAYRDLWHERQVERAMAHIPDEVRAVKDRAIQEVFAKDFAALDPQAQATVLKMLEYMEKKCVAIPIKAAKAIALRGKKQTEKVG